MTLTTPMPTGAAPDPGGRSARRPAASRAEAAVVAVIVAHDGERWLPRALEALLGQSRRPDVVVGVDTGSKDSSAQLLRAALGADRVVQAPRSTGFGAAVATGLASLPAADHSERDGWVWLLHDDCAPDPRALEHLLDVGSRSSQVGVVGPKLVGWDDPTQLLEVGLTVGRTGRRDNGLDGPERDQGQHDHRSDVLAVGTAGMLVRRDLWDRLGGLDPALGLLRDDIDLCWRAHLAGRRVVLAPGAVVADAQASTQRLRPTDALRTSVHRADLRHGLHVALARCSPVTVPLVLARAVVVAVLRSLLLLAAKAPGRALDEVLAVAVVVLMPWRWIGSRWRARGTRVVRRSSLTGLLTPRFVALRHAGDVVAGWAVPERDGARTAQAAEPGPTADEASSFVPPRATVPRRVLRHPLTLLLVAVAALTAVAGRRLLQAGVLTGGELGRVTGTPSALWHAGADTVRGAGLGTDLVASPAAGVQAAAMWALQPLAGDQAAARAVDLLLLGAPVLAALSAYVCARVATRSPWLRVWAAAVWAVSPVLTGALAEGRLGPVAAWVLLPLAAAALARALTPRSHGSLTAVFGGALALALIGSLLPTLLVVGVLVALVGVVTSRGAGRVRALLLAVLPVALLGPWLRELVRDPELTLSGPGALQVGAPLDRGGLAGLSDVLSTVVLLPAGWPTWAAAALLLPVPVVALVAVLRLGSRGRLAAGLWAVGLLGLVGALVAPRVLLSAGTAGTPPLRAWAGPGVAVLLLCALTAVVASADGLQARLARHGFGWRQLLLGPVVLLALLAPLAAAASWALRGTDSPVQRADAVSLPAVAADAAQGPSGTRTLVLTQTPGALTYRLVGAEPAPWARDVPVDDDPGVVARTVAGLATPGAGTLPDGDGVPALQRLAVGFVLVSEPVAAPLAERLDQTAGLVRIGAPRGGQLWRVGSALAPETARVRVLTATSAPQEQGADLEVQAGVQAAVPVAGAHGRVDTDVTGGPAGRRLVLAELASQQWRATLGGRSLEPVALEGDGSWRQAFLLPSGGGHLVVERVDPVVRTWRRAQLGLLLLVALLALPVRRPAEARS